MATLAEADPLTREHVAEQLRISRAAQLEATALWRLLQVPTLDASSPQWIAAHTKIVLEARRRSAVAAGGYYDALRMSQLGEGAALVPGTVKYRGIVLPDEAVKVPAATAEAVATSARVTGPVRVYQSLAMGRPPAEAMNYGLRGILGSTQRQVLNGGRTAISSLLGLEPRTTFYQRVASGSACQFCQMLAGRGPVYSASTGDFDAHDYCACAIEPVFSATKKRVGTGVGRGRRYRVVTEAVAPVSPLSQ